MRRLIWIFTVCKCMSEIYPLSEVTWLYITHLWLANAKTSLACSQAQSLTLCGLETPFPLQIESLVYKGLTLYLMDAPFNALANRADPNQAALQRAAWSGSTLYAYGNMIYLILHKWTWQVISLFQVPSGKFIYIIIHSGWSLAWIFMNVKGWSRWTINALARLCRLF